MALVHLGFILDTVRNKGYDTRIISSRHLDDSDIVMRKSSPINDTRRPCFVSKSCSTRNSGFKTILTS